MSPAGDHRKSEVSHWTPDRRTSGAVRIPRKRPRAHAIGGFQAAPRAGRAEPSRAQNSACTSGISGKRPSVSLASYRRAEIPAHGRSSSAVPADSVGREDRPATSRVEISLTVSGQRRLFQARDARRSRDTERERRGQQPTAFPPAHRRRRVASTRRAVDRRSPALTTGLVTDRPVSWLSATDALRLPASLSGVSHAHLHLTFDGGDVYPSRPRRRDG